MILNLFRSIYYSWKFRGRDVWIKRTSRIHNDTELEGMNRIAHRTDFRGRLGYASYIGTDCRICADIGRYSSIAPFCTTNAGIHTYRYPFASTSPMFFNRDHLGGRSFADRDVIQNLRYADSERRLDVKIGHDVWIGQGVFMAGGITIGDGAMVMAGAVVTKNVEPYAIVGGVPAKLLGHRYDQSTINFLLRLRWWDKPLEWLRENWELINDLPRLKATFPECLDPQQT